MLDQADVVDYLLERGLLSRRAVVDGSVVVSDATSRNRNFKVECREGPSYLLKQGLDDDGLVTVAHEAAVYRSLSSGNRALRRYLPGYFGYDDDDQVLVLELVSARDLREYHTETRRFPVTLGAWIGEALGALHRVTGVADGGNLDPKRAPWILSVHRPDLEIFRDSSAASLELIKMIQSAPEFGSRLDDVRDGWRVGALLHHDVKWDNLLACSASGSGRIRGLKLIDWEIAAEGDPCWDIGSVFSNYLSSWIFSIPVTGRHPPERFAELARLPLASMQPALRRCWQAYVGALGLGPVERRRWIVRAVEMAAARLIQTAFEATQMSTQLRSNVLLHLQVSLNILQRPEEAALHLLGIPVWEPARR